MATTITDATGLDNIRLDLAGDYVLGADIDLSGIANWTPIGTSGAPFTGTLDFAGFAITGLATNQAAINYVGLFGFCRFNDAAKIPNFKGGSIAGTVTGPDCVGLLAGYIETTLGSTGVADVDPAIGQLVYDITGSGTVSGANKVGGLIGMVKGPQFAGWADKQNVSQGIVHADWIARVEGLTCSADVTGSGAAIGGVVGETYEINVNLANSTGVITGGDKVGGIVGVGYRPPVQRSYSTGAITGTKLVGGIIGFATYRPPIRYCHSEGAITGTGGTYPGQLNATLAGVGGIAGYCDLEDLLECFALGDVTGVYRAGGLVGSCSGGDAKSPNFQRCYARGNISVSGSQVGGLIGFMYAGQVQWEQCYCTGSVTGSMAGALIGVRGSYIEYGEEIAELMPEYATPVGTVTYYSDCFYNSDVNTASNQYGGSGLTDAQMKLQTSYETSDLPWNMFDNYWVIDDEEGDYYPQLLTFYEPYGLTLAVVRGAQGLTLAYTKAGEVFYRQLDSGTGTWGVETQVANFAGVNTLNLFRTRDDRIGFVATEGSYMEWAVTDPNLMTIDIIRTLTRGYYGDVLDTPDGEACLFYVTDVGTLAQLKGVVADGWDLMDLGLGDPLPSDSQITRLRANIFGEYGYLVWRSRGQHRFVRVLLDKAQSETVLVRTGSITMSLDSPIVSVSLELDGGVS